MESIHLGCDGDNKWPQCGKFLWVSGGIKGGAPPLNEEEGGQLSSVRTAQTIRTFQLAAREAEEEEEDTQRNYCVEQTQWNQ